MPSPLSLGLRFPGSPAGWSMASDVRLWGQVREAPASYSRAQGGVREEDKYETLPYSQSLDRCDLYATDIVTNSRSPREISTHSSYLENRPLF